MRRSIPCGMTPPMNERHLWQWGFLMATVLGWGAAFAAPPVDTDLAVLGRGYTDACGYYQRTEGDFEILHRNPALPWGTKVFVIYGFGSGDSDWLDRSEVEAKAVGPYLWSAKLSKTLHFRSSSDRLDSLQLVLKIRHPSGEEFYLKGSESILGFMEAKFNFVGASPCMDRSKTKPSLTRLETRSVERG